MERPVAWIIATGNEVTTGQVADTNGALIASALEEIGCRAARHAAVGDILEDIVEVLKEAEGKARIVVCTGGLGPTSDDLTGEAVSAAFGLPLVFDEAYYGALKAFFENRGISMPESNRKQALIPEGAETLANPIGTARGYALRRGTTRFFFAPGVPRELKRMLPGEILPRVKEEIGAAEPRRVLTLRTFGLPESRLGELLENLEGGGLSLGYRATFPTIDVKLVAVGESTAEAEARLEEGMRAVFSRVGEYIYADGEKTLPQAVGDLLRSEGARLACAESCTGGLISKLVTDAAGSSDYFERGFVTYSNRSKVDLLGVRRETLEAHGAVSEATVLEMAAGARERSGADYAVAVTGVAGPGGGTPEKPVGTVWLALASATGAQAKLRKFGGDRDQVRLITAHAALDWVRRRLLGLG